MADPHIRSLVARPRNWFAGLLVTLALLAGWSAPQGQARRALRGTFGTSPQQCANRINGTSSAINDCSGVGWVNGNLNRNNSVYRQGDFVPFRTPITGLVAGRTYSIRIGYDAVESGLHAYDYLGSFDASAAPGQQIVPCYGQPPTAGPHACGNNPSTVAVPVDTNTTFPSGAGQVPGSFSAWGGTLQSVAYVNPAPIGVNTPGTVERAIDVTFTAAGGNVVLAWGGHIASALDWGAGRTYTSVHNGAPFHMRLKQVQEGGQPPEVIGNQELSMHAAALAAAPGLTTQVAPTTATTDQTVIDTATLTGVAGKPVTGAVQFFVCGPAGGPPDCSQGGTPVGVPQVVNTIGGGPNGQATIAFPQPGQGPIGPGQYCFRAEYTPSNVAEYSPVLHTDTTTECFLAKLPPPLLTVTKLCDPESDTGLFNLLLDGSPVPNGTDVPCGGGSGPFETTVGSHTVSESAGTGTNLADYMSAFGGDCAPAGLLTLSLGDSAVCTITNTRIPPLPPASLTVNKVCDPADDPGNFVILVDDQPIAALDCGESATPVELAPGTYTVREASGEDTSLSDYTTVISGDCAADGSITLASGDSLSCTFTNTHIAPVPQPATLRVDKACDPAGDDGHFRLGIFTTDGHPVHRVVVDCGGTTGDVQVSAGLYQVREGGANGTDLSHYNRYIGGDCAADGTIAVQAGDQATCQITNVRRGTEPKPAELTVTKSCVPVDDGGLFNLTVDGKTLQDVACGHSFGPVALPPGQHLVSESAGTGTSLSDYETTIGGACAPDGSVTLSAGEQATCTVTNVRTSTEPPVPPEETGTVEVEKHCSPAGTQGLFQAELDEHLFRVACGQSVGPVAIGVGDHRIGEVALIGRSRTFETTMGGDCSPSGSFTLSAGQHVTCIVTNTLVTTEPPLKPPPACYTLSVRPRTATAGRLVRVVARVHLGRRPIAGVRVRLRGPGVSASLTTGPRGLAVFRVTANRRGILRVTARRPFMCPKPPSRDIGVSGVVTPPVTG